eukprot:11202520-Lingulodinium_polyedra.AAC.1
MQKGSWQPIGPSPPHLGGVPSPLAGQTGLVALVAPPPTRSATLGPRKMNHVSHFYDLRGRGPCLA